MAWKQALIPLIMRIVTVLWDVYEERKRRKQDAKRQAARKKMEQDPADWFGDHFGGKRVPMESPGDDAGEADKTEN